jgi:hypothetical protein
MKNRDRLSSHGNVKGGSPVLYDPIPALPLKYGTGFLLRGEGRFYEVLFLLNSTL